MPFYAAPNYTFAIYSLFFTKISLKRIALPSTNTPKPKKVNLSTLYNKRWAIVPENQAKRVDAANILYYITKLKKSVEY